MKELGPIPSLGSWPIEEQRSLAAILSTSSIEVIAAGCAFPDWLGYLGLALSYTEDAERQDRHITQSWSPQLARLVACASPAGTMLAALTEKSAGLLTWRVLESVESGLRAQ